MTTDADKIDNLLAQRRELMDKIEEQIDERGRIIERIQSAPDSPIARLRARHQRWIDPQPDRATDTCTKCPEPWPCDTIAALDALQEEIMCLSDGPSVDWWQHAVNELRQQAEALAVTLEAIVDGATVHTKYLDDQLVERCITCLERWPCKEPRP